MGGYNFSFPHHSDPRISYSLELDDNKDVSQTNPGKFIFRSFSCKIVGIESDEQLSAIQKHVSKECAQSDWYGSIKIALSKLKVNLVEKLTLLQSDWRANNVERLQFWKENPDWHESEEGFAKDNRLSAKSIDFKTQVGITQDTLALIVQIALLAKNMSEDEKGFTFPITFDNGDESQKETLF